MSAAAPLLKPERLNGLAKERYRKILERSRLKTAGLFSFAAAVFGAVQKRGDRALRAGVKKYDKVDFGPGDLVVTKEEIKAADRKLTPEQKEALKKLSAAVQSYHAFQKAETSGWFAPLPFRAGKETPFLGRMFVPFDRAGVYVPGGKGEKDCYPTTAVMAVTPAKIAGVREIVVCTPPKKDGTIPPAVLYACAVSGADKIIKAGGAHAIAALACGTETVPKADIIVGPGNVYVTAAKSYAAANGLAAIDFPAGPSELLIVADDTADPEYVVSDLLAQAEHDENACPVLVTTSRRLACEVADSLNKAVRSKTLPRAAIIKKSLKNYGAVLLAGSLREMINFSNEFAPEHLELLLKNDAAAAAKIRNAGLLCLGPYSPVAAADYLSGTNHILPTGRAACWASSVCVENFLKRVPVQCLNRAAIVQMAPAVETLAALEGLSGHAASLKRRTLKAAQGKSALLNNPRLLLEKIKNR